MNRAFSALQIKSASEVAGKRIFSGIATTISADSVGDIVEPRGAVFTLPLPLLWGHDSAQPIGWVTSATVTDAGIEVVCEVAIVNEPGTLKARIDEVWSMLKAKLAQGLSIGFSAIESARIDSTRGRRFIKWVWRELSVVVLPANTDCSITAIKAAALGQHARSPSPSIKTTGVPMSDVALLTINSRFELGVQPATGDPGVKLALTRIQAQRLADELQSFAMNSKSINGERSLVFPVALADADDATGKSVYLKGREPRPTLRLDSGKRPGVLYLNKPTPKSTVVRLKK